MFNVAETRYLWCTWHVDRAWKDGLRRYVATREEQRDLYHHLKVMMMETNMAQFRQLLSQFLTLSIAPSFTNYFQSTYCSHIQQWATSYRLGTPMNTNLFSESFHRVLKIVYLQHKQNRRVDYLIYTLLKISRDKVFEQFCKFEKGKTTHNIICNINKRHKTALTFSSLAIIEDVGSNSYRVMSQTCPSQCKCKLKCRFCNTCAHMYTCTCLDACTTVCKHMHLIHMCQPQRELHQADLDREKEIEYFMRITTPQLSSHIPTVPLLLEKIHQRVTDMLTMCNYCNDTETLQKIYHHLGSALGELGTTKITLKCKPSHQNSKIQPRYYSTQKRRKLTSQSVSKPTEIEVTSSQARLKILRQIYVEYASQKMIVAVEKLTGFHAAIA